MHSVPHSVLFLPSFIEVTTHTDESTNKIGKGAGSTLRRFDVSSILLTEHRVVSKCIQVPSAPWCCTAAAGYYPQLLQECRILSTASTFHFRLSARPMHSRPFHSWYASSLKRHSSNVLFLCTFLCTAGKHPLSKDTRQMFLFFCTSGMNPLSKVKCSFSLLHLQYQPCPDSLKRM